jgi:hypothetical protein
MPSDFLNPSQKLRITIVLRLFEEHLRMALLVLEGYSERGILYSKKLEISENAKEEVRSKILAALEEISHVAKTLDLEMEIQNAGAIIGGEMSIDWVNLTDIHARSLSGYGNVHPDLGSVIDQSLDRLAGAAFAIQAILRKNR